MSLENARAINFEKFDLFGKTVLFAGERIDRNSLPAGVYAYDLREGDSGYPATIEDVVWVDYYGTVLTTEKIFFEEADYTILEDEDYGFLGETITLDKFLQESGGIG